MKTISLRNLPPRIADLIEDTARARGLSANRAVIHLLERLLPSPVTGRYHDLDHLIGSWSKEDADAFDRALREQRPVPSAKRR